MKLFIQLIKNSWRKQYETDVKYKGNRVQSTDVDWKMLFEVHDEFVKALEKLGVIITAIPGAEGDDGIFAWTSFLNSIDRNSIIISGDNDLLQLNYHNGDVNTIYYNKFDKKIHTANGFNNWLNSNTSNDVVDMFNLNTKDFFNIKDELKKDN